MTAPKPKAIHILNGTFRKDRHGSRARRPTKPPTPPKTLPPIAKKQWRSLAKALAGAGLIGGIDVELLEQFCRTAFEVRQAREVIDREGATYTHNGLIKVHPMVAVYDRKAKLLVSLGDRLGMSPLSRARLRTDLPADSSEDEFADVFDDGRGGIPTRDRSEGARPILTRDRSEGASDKKSTARGPHPNKE